MAEREDANPLGRMPARPSPLRSVNRNIDDYPLGYPKLATFLDSDEDFMVCRRFGFLHARVLSYRQDELDRLERDLDELDENSRKREESTSHKSRNWLLKTIEEKLSDYDSLILRAHHLAQISRSSACHYQSVREYLDHGPPIYMDYSTTRSNRWASYESVVGDLLEDPETAPWLDGPLDQDWAKTLLQQKQWSDHDCRSVEDLSWRYRIKRTLDHMAGTLLWISHITAALGFVLISNASGPEGTPLLKFLLAYWYFSAVSIVVQGLYGKGFIYARKVFFGGLLACPAGFYILNILLNIPTASSFTAMPTIFTVVLLLIRTM